MTTSVVTDAFGQLEVSHAVITQRAFRTAELARDTTLSTFAQSVPVPLTAAAMEESLIHVQVEAEAHAKSKRALQGKVVPNPALFVLASKLMRTFDPSLLNTAEVRTGAGSGADVGRTATLRLGGYCTSYWCADCPVTVTL
jgi:hypothetical protein